MLAPTHSTIFATPQKRQGATKYRLPWKVAKCHISATSAEPNQSKWLILNDFLSISHPIHHGRDGDDFLIQIQQLGAIFHTLSTLVRTPVRPNTACCARPVHTGRAYQQSSWSTASPVQQHQRNVRTHAVSGPNCSRIFLASAGVAGL